MGGRSQSQVLLIKQLVKVVDVGGQRRYRRSDPQRRTAFTSSSMDRITTSVPLLEPAHPKGQAFALLEGGTLWKLRMPLPIHEPNTGLPDDLRVLAEQMRRHYSDDAPTWHAQACGHA